MKKTIILLFIFFVFIYSASFWSNCGRLRNNFHLDKYKILLSLEDHINNDAGIVHAVVRIFHNKPVYFFTEPVKKYLMFFDLVFLARLLSPLVIFGFLISLYHVFNGMIKGWKIWISLILLTVLPFVEIFIELPVFFPLKLSVFSFPFLLLSFSGIKKQADISKNKRVFWEIIFFLGLISLLWGYLFQNNVYSYCIYQ